MLSDAKKALSHACNLALGAAIIASCLACSGIVDYPEPPGPGGAGGVAPVSTTPPSSTPAPTMTPAPGADNGCDAMQSQVTTALTTYCSGCHAAPANEAKFDYVLDPLKLQASGKIVVGKSAQSPLFNMISSGKMPPAGKQPRPTAADIQLIGQWIDGCLAPPQTMQPQGGSCQGKKYSTQDIVAAMVRDVQALDITVRPRTRYFSLAHLSNQGVCGAAMDTYRFALAKAANALSLGTQLVLPTPVDDDKLVYRIDLRDYGWDRADNGEDQWDRMVRENPYAFERLDDQSEVLKLFTGTDVPVQAGDWFVNTATQPPLYHELLNIPATLPGLEAQLGISIARDIANGDVWRSGFLTSGVSQTNRVIERHEIPSSGSRSLWISYDFAQNGGREDIFSDPLDFQADGSEIIFSLPNGLHGYMVANSAGTRLDAAPDTIVVDPNQLDRNVRDGISCMSCHVGGIKPKQDQIRDFVLKSLDFSDRDKETVADLYPSAETFAALVDKDASTFQLALKAVDPVGPSDSDPIITVFQSFDEDVSLDRAASELGIDSQTLLVNLGRLDTSLAALASGSVKRKAFKAAFPAAVCQLNLGLNSNPACASRVPGR